MQTMVHFIESRCQNFDNEISKLILAKDFFSKKFVGFLIKIGAANLDRISSYHDLETDDSQPLSEAKKREIVSSINLGFKSGVFPIVLAYKDLEANSEQP